LSVSKIRSVLIANRGEIAVRVASSVQRLGRRAIVPYHDVDARSLAVRVADQAVRIDGPSPVSAYLSMEALLQAARQAGADAVHPGFGFLAENAVFARRVQEAGLAWIGPPPEAIEAMGDKIRSKQLARAAGVNTIPGGEQEIRDAAHALEVATQVGFPVMIKASAGGGGKGLRVVRSAAEVAAAFERTRGEARAAFGDERVFIEKFIERPRHIEFQVLGDAHGGLVHLGERECSIQRRHQKLIEEAPSPFLDAATREAMAAQALALARAVGYRSAGTVEFVVDAQRQFYFLEMNTRIQVEHPVTEMTTGIDLVAEQLRIAEGEPLGYDQGQVRHAGHAIECRLCAEDAAQDFAPATGKLHVFHTPSDDGLRVDSGVAEGDEVTANFDSMLAKLIVTGRDRDEAIARMRAALAGTAALGLTTNAAYLQRVLAHPAFIRGETHTGFLIEHAAQLAVPEPTPEQLPVLIAAALLTNRTVADPRYSAPALHAAIGDWRG
jgi:propionyl-CoA carboxylase alpha chain